MSIQDFIINRRSIKKFEQDSYFEDAQIQQAIELSAYAPNHGMREPWRIIWVKKDRLSEYGRLFAEVNFKNDNEKGQAFTAMAQKLGGILIIAGPVDRRQKQRLEDVLAIGGYMQTLSLLLFDAGIGSCIKTPASMFEPKFNAALGIHDDEMIYGLVYLTELPEQLEDKPRKNSNLISEF
ncbi:nitroreductase family protein [Macrococcus brunensis]|uniref:nitroreductase family protein n=1 Tax=Macrococcus brunensis TaxID=198483 RepID=UPI001EF0DFC5|nr:nitroreductase [Macrococcus brunensis]ULG74824.1 nitroreductase [Macrococcus brunensis]